MIMELKVRLSWIGREITRVPSKWKKVRVRDSKMCCELGRWRKGSRAKERSQLLKARKGKKMGSPLESLEEPALPTP